MPLLFTRILQLMLWKFVIQRIGSVETWALSFAREDYFLFYGGEVYVMENL